MHTAKIKQENNNIKTLRFTYELCSWLSNLVQLPFHEIMHDRLLDMKLLNKKYERPAVGICEQTKHKKNSEFIHDLLKRNGSFKCHCFIFLIVKTIIYFLLTASKYVHRSIDKEIANKVLYIVYFCYQWNSGGMKL